MDTTSTALRIWEADPQAPAWAGMQAGLAWRRMQLAAQEQAVQMKQQAVGLIGQELQNKQRSMMIDSEQTELNRQVQDQPKWAEVSRQPWQDVLKNPMQTFESQKYNVMWNGLLNRAAQLQRAEALSVESRQTMLDDADFRRRNSMLSPDLRIQTDPGKPPSPTMWQALRLGEEAEGVRRENARKQAEIDALQRGDVPETRIDAKGNVSTVFKPVKAQVKPVVEEVDGIKLAYNPATGSFRFPPSPKLPTEKQQIDQRIKIESLIEKKKADLRKGESQMTPDEVAKARASIAAWEQKLADPTKEVIVDPNDFKVNPGSSIPGSGATNVPVKKFRYDPATGKLQPQ